MKSYMILLLITVCLGLMFYLKNIFESVSKLALLQDAAVSQLTQGDSRAALVSIKEVMPSDMSLLLNETEVLPYYKQTVTQQVDFVKNLENLIVNASHKVETSLRLAVKAYEMQAGLDTLELAKELESLNAKVQLDLPFSASLSGKEKRFSISRSKCNTAAQLTPDSDSFVKTIFTSPADGACLFDAIKKTWSCPSWDTILAEGCKLDDITEESSSSVYTCHSTDDRYIWKLWKKRLAGICQKPTYLSLKTLANNIRETLDQRSIWTEVSTLGLIFGRRHDLLTYPAEEGSAESCRLKQTIRLADFNFDINAVIVSGALAAIDTFLVSLCPVVDDFSLSYVNVDQVAIHKVNKALQQLDFYMTIYKNKMGKLLTKNIDACEIERHVKKLFLPKEEDFVSGSISGLEAIYDNPWNDKLIDPRTLTAEHEVCEGYDASTTVIADQFSGTTLACQEAVRAAKMAYYFSTLSKVCSKCDDLREKNQQEDPFYVVRCQS